MGEVKHEMTVTRPPGEVRPYLLEPHLVRRWQKRLVEYEFTTPGPPAVGSECRGSILVARRRIGWRARVTEWDEGGYTLRSLGNGPAFELSWRLEAEGGGSRVKYRQASPAFDGMTGHYVQQLVDRVARRDLERLRRLIDGEPADSALHAG